MSIPGPQGRLTTPWLMVRGNALVRGRRTTQGSRTGEGLPVVLRGFNLSGLQHREFYRARTFRWRDAAGFSSAVLRKVSTEWNINLIRLPVNRDWYLEGLAAAGWDRQETRRRYRDDIREIVAELSACGVYTLLNPHSQAFSSGDARLYTPPMPDERHLEFWEAAAAEFHDMPAVLYDLFNEPHLPLLPPLEPLFTGTTPDDPAEWINVWHEWARSIAGVIHTANPDAVLFVSGIGGPCWASSLRSMPIPVPPFTKDVNRQRYLPNTVYAAHVYPHRAARGPDLLGGEPRAPGTMGRRGFDYWFGFPELRKRYPVFVSEWGCCLERNCDHPDCAGRRWKTWKAAGKRWLGKLESTMRQRHTIDRRGEWQGLAGWTAWSWGDHPHLVLNDGQGNYRTTEFGGMIQRALRRPA